LVPHSSSALVEVQQQLTDAEGCFWLRFWLVGTVAWIFVFVVIDWDSLTGPCGEPCAEAIRRNLPDLSTKKSWTWEELTEGDKLERAAAFVSGELDYH